MVLYKRIKASFLFLMIGSIYYFFFTLSSLGLVGYRIDYIFLLFFLLLAIKPVVNVISRLDFFLFYTAFVLLVVVYVLTSIDLKTSFSYFPTIIFLYFSSAGAYQYALNGRFSNKDFRTVFYIVLSCSILVFVNIFMRKLDVLGEDIVTQSNNAGYLLVSSMILSWFCFKSKPKLSFFIVFSLFFLVLFTFKRGAIVLGAILVFFYVCEIFINKLSTKKLLFFSIVFLIPVIYFSSFYIVNNYEEISFLKRFGQSGGSLRDVIYSTILDAWTSSGFLNLLFGNGFFSATYLTAEATGTNYDLWAHSDFLEILYDHGIFGLSIYILVILSFVSRLGLVFHYNKDLLIIYLYLMMYWLAKAGFSGFYVDKSSFVALGILAAIVGQAEYIKRKTKIKIRTASPKFR